MAERLPGMCKALGSIPKKHQKRKHTHKKETVGTPEEATSNRGAPALAHRWEVGTELPFIHLSR
jgi:hypothetical protein